MLTGFRATGKTAVGRRLAVELGYDFVDTDALLVERLGSPIADAVRSHGWQRFRDLERKLLLELAGGNKMVLATGGGAVLHEQAWKRLRKDALVVWLQADVQTIVERLSADRHSAGQRPSLTGRDFCEEVPDLLAQREPLYFRGADITLSTEDFTPDELAAILYDQVTSGNSSKESA